MLKLDYGLEWFIWIVLALSPSPQSEDLLELYMRDGHLKKRQSLNARLKCAIK